MHFYYDVYCNHKKGLKVPSKEIIKQYLGIDWIFYHYCRSLLSFERIAILTTLLPDVHVLPYSFRCVEVKKHVSAVPLGHRGLILVDVSAVGDAIVHTLLITFNRTAGDLTFIERKSYKKGNR